MVFSIGSLLSGGPFLSRIPRKVRKLTFLSGSRYFRGGGERGATFGILRVAIKGRTI